MINKAGLGGPRLCNLFHLSLLANNRNNNKLYGAALETGFTVFKQH